jgi:hypothetical protein
VYHQTTQTNAPKPLVQVTLIAGCRATNTLSRPELVCSWGYRLISPMLVVGTIEQESSNTVDDCSELMVIEGPDQDTAGVVTARLAPFP